MQNGNAGPLASAKHTFQWHTPHRKYTCHTHTLAHTHTRCWSLTAAFGEGRLCFFAHVATVWDCLLPHHHHVPQKLAKCLASPACALLSSARLGLHLSREWSRAVPRATRHTTQSLCQLPLLIDIGRAGIQCDALRFVRSGSQSYIGQRQCALSYAAGGLRLLLDLASSRRRCSRTSCEILVLSSARCDHLSDAVCRIRMHLIYWSSCLLRRSNVCAAHSGTRAMKMWGNVK